MRTEHGQHLQSFENLTSIRQTTMQLVLFNSVGNQCFFHPASFCTNTNGLKNAAYNATLVYIFPIIKKTNKPQNIQVVKWNKPLAIFSDGFKIIQSYRCLVVWMLKRLSYCIQSLNGHILSTPCKLLVTVTDLVLKKPCIIVEANTYLTILKNVTSALSS